MNQTTDIMGMSDEDFLNANLSDFDLPESEALDESTEESTEVLDESLEEDVNSSQEAVEEESEETLDETEETEDADVTEEESSTEDEDASTEEDESELDDTDTNDVDYESFYKALAEPLKVAGSEVVIDDPVQMRRLMSMGADYNLKMQALKPVRKVVKMLENNDLMDEAKLSYLIDLSKHSPEAIAKLVQESGVDTMSLDTEEEVKYTPSNYAVSDTSVELDDVLERIQATPSFSDTIDITTKMDEASKSTLAKNPRGLEILNEHVSNGIYAMVQKRIAKERVMGTLGNLSDLDAYQHVGRMLAQEGAFNSPADKDKKVVSSKPKHDTKSDERKDKRHKASPTKSSKPQPKPKYNYLDMSDEDFENNFS